MTVQRAYRFWNHTCTTLMSRPVSWANCSRTCLAGFGELLYASFNTSIWRVVIVVRGRLLPSLLSETISQGFLNDVCAIVLDSRTSWLSCFKVLLAKKLFVLHEEELVTSVQFSSTNYAIKAIHVVDIVLCSSDDVRRKNPQPTTTAFGSKWPSKEWNYVFSSRCSV